MMGKQRGQKWRRVGQKSPKESNIISLASFAQDCDIKMEDCISRLPDEVLFFILSLLTFREAARTSILCRRWKCLWMSLQNLVFDFTNMTGNVIDIRSEKSRCEAIRKRRKFVRWVNQVLLEQNTSEKILSCKIAYPFGGKYRHCVDKWVWYLANKGVEELDIDATTFGGYMVFNSCVYLYRFPYWFFALSHKCSSLKCLSLDACLFDVPPFDSKSFIRPHFDNLISLTLKHTCMFRNEAMDNILSSSLSLEYLSLSLCYVPPHIKIAPNPRSKTLKLKYLSLVYCVYLETIEIHKAVDLDSFECMGGDFFSKISLIDSVQPRKLSFCPTLETSQVLDYAFGDLVVDFPLVERLRFHFPKVEDNIVPKQLHTFSMLTELDLIIVKTSHNGLFQLTSSLLAASPFLCRLIVHSACPIGEKAVRENITSFHEGNNSFRHERLKDVEIVDFRGHDIQTDLVFYLLRVAVNLQKLKIVRKGMIYWGG